MSKQKNTFRMKNITVHRTRAFTLIEAMIITAIIGLLASIAIPNFQKAREQAMINQIMANIEEISHAKVSWYASRGDLTPQEKQAKAREVIPRGEDIARYLKGGWPVKAVAGETYRINNMLTYPEALLEQKLLGHEKGKVITKMTFGEFYR